MEENQNNSPENSNKMNPMLIGGIVVAIFVIGAVVVLGMQGQNSQITTEEVVEEIPSPTASGTESMVAESTIEVEGGAFYFKPNEIRVKAGQTITIRLNSVATDKGMPDKKMMHDFVIDELNVQSEEAEEGSSTTFTFTPTEKGEYEFYCSVGEHRANGMFGTLIVE